MLGLCFQCGSQADFPEDGSERELPLDFVQAVRGIKMDGPARR